MRLLPTEAMGPETSAYIVQLEDRIEELEGCAKQSIERGNEVIRLGREVVTLRERIEDLIDEIAQLEAGEDW